MPRILIVEDDAAVRDVVEHTLAREGMETIAVPDGETALERLRADSVYDLIILDVRLPGIDGISVCRELRSGGTGKVRKELPVIMLSAKGDETSVVVGLEVGADDYVTKPFRPRELASRVRSHLRRQQVGQGDSEQQKLVFPDLELDLHRKLVIRDGKPVNLTAMQFAVLAFLASHPGRVYSREQIMRHLWDGNFFGESHAANVHIQHIRQKIEDDPKNPRYVQTVRGMGYRFAEL